MEEEEILNNIMLGLPVPAGAIEAPDPLPGLSTTPPPKPTGFPEDVAPLYLEQFTNWALSIVVRYIWVAAPRDEAAVVAIANWAKNNEYKVRARGSSHNWSPLVLSADSDFAKTILVDTSALSQMAYTEKDNMHLATFGAGVTVDAATAYLQQKGGPDSSGFSLINMPAPGILTIGGAVAIGAHGTSVDIDSATGADTGFTRDMGGCVSDLIVSFKAVVSDTSGDYAVQQFDRTNAEASAFLVHLGRAFITEVTMLVTPNYYLEVRNQYPDKSDLFQPPSASLKANALQTLVSTAGRVEVIWFPYTSTPWVKVWRYLEKPTKLILRHAPYPYIFANDITLDFSRFIKGLYLKNPAKTPQRQATAFGFVKGSVRGAPYHVMQGLSRNLLLYVKPSTLRVTALGYAIHIRRSDIQLTANMFYTFFSSLLDKYRNLPVAADGSGGPQYPVNGPVELRFNTIDRGSKIIPGAKPPMLSATSQVDSSCDTVFWINVLSFPETVQLCAGFYAELEQWIRDTWGERARPEWSKGWGYSAEGPYTNQAVIQTAIRTVMYSHTYETAKSILAKYDSARIYSNAFLDKII